MRLIQVLILLTCGASSFAQGLAASPCNDAKTCGECIQFDETCGWCTQADFGDSGHPRCDTIQSLRMQQCPENEITQPQSTTTITEDVPLSDAGAGVGEAVQIKPQAVTLRLRPGEPASFNFSVRQAEDYPVDLYYVMDLSKSMDDDLQNLKLLGNTLALEMKAITKNFRLGFGSFVDKVVMPYVSTVPSKLLAPCNECEAPYGFKNVLPLTVETDQFETTVSAQRASGNLDAPEGGMDALMQVTVCQEAIGWRNQARHMVIFTTDASFHYAGDGKLGGIVTPNDGACHMDAIGSYNYSTILDYPSISQLNAKMRENSIIPIFAVTQDEYEVYNNLTQYIEGSIAAVLAADSGNIVNLVKDNYAAITSKVEVIDNAPENVTVAYIAYCLNNVVKPNSRVCEDLKLGDTVTFQMTVTAEMCPKDRTPQTFTVSPVGFSEELTITIEYICECDCESSKIENSDKCTSGNGTLECGSCVCNPGRYGRTCECSSDDPNLEDNDASCRAGNSSIICSGRGSCVCGSCMCFPRPNSAEIVKGTYCECDNFSCDRYKGELCGGADRGTCICDEKLRRSKCQCKQGYEGPACECSTRKDTCMAANGVSCNGYGECVCGECRCNATTPYRGPRCEECPACPGKCDVNKECVQCKAFGEVLTPEQCDRCPYPVIKKQELNIPAGSDRCPFQDEKGCSFIFTYETLANGSFILLVQEDKVCPEPINPLIVIIPIVVGIIVIGILLLLLWRLLIYLWDKKEYQQFEKDRQNAKWEMGENPIYKPSTTVHKNPMYGK